MKRRLLIASCFLVVSMSCLSQDLNHVASLIDSASQNLRNPYLTVDIANDILKKSESLDYKFGLASGNKFKGIGYYYSGRLDSAFTFYSRSLTLFEELGDSLEIAKALINVATYYNAIAEYEQSVEKSLQSLALFRKLNDLQGEARVQNIIGQSYYFQEDYEEAKNYFNDYYQTSLTSGDSVEISSSLSNLGAAFQELGEIDSALFYLERAVQLKERLNFQGNIGTSYYNLGELFSGSRDFLKAEEYFNKAESFYIDLSDTLRLSELFLARSDMDYNRGRLKSATIAAKTSLQLAEKSSANEVKQGALAQLAELSADQNDFNAAYNYLTDFVIVSEGILNEENINSINRLREEFQTKEKEQQIALQQAELATQEAQIQRNQVFLFSLFLIVILLIVVFLLWKNRTEKAAALERQEAQLKLREAEINAVINSQEKERSRFAKDLHDGFGQLISVLKLSLNDVKRVDMKDADKRMEIYKNGESVINEMYSELRNICFDLMPQTLVKRGLTPALKEFGLRLNQSDQLNCEVLIFNNTARLKEIYEISLFRITQEWVNNVLKYSGGNHLTIQMTKEDNELTLTVEDNGDGFDVNQFFQGNGNGWKNIQSRLKQINGEFDLDSQFARKGTMMTVNVPLTPESFIPTSTEQELTH